MRDEEREDQTKCFSGIEPGYPIEQAVISFNTTNETEVGAL